MHKHKNKILLFALAPALIAPILFAGEGDKAAILKVHADFAAAWNLHDPAAMAGKWTEDGDLINPEGRVARGRGEVQKLFADEQGGLFKSSTFTNSISSVRLLAPTVAVVDASYEISNATPPGSDAPVTLKGLYMSVMLKKAGKWWTASPLAMAPAPMSGSSPR